MKITDSIGGIIYVKPEDKSEEMTFNKHIEKDLLYGKWEIANMKELTLLFDEITSRNVFILLSDLSLKYEDLTQESRDRVEVKFEAWQITQPEKYEAWKQTQAKDLDF